MSELILTRDERVALRARAHHLNPVVLLGAAGLTEAVVKETDRALAAHELIKVRIPGDDRGERESIGLQLADRLGAARVQSIGKLLVLYRPRPEADAPAPSDLASKRPRSTPPTVPRRAIPAKGRQPLSTQAARPPRRGGSRSR